jgi:NAD(P)H-flavin reductase
VRESPLDWLPGFDKKFAELTHRMVKDLEKCMQCGIGQCGRCNLGAKLVCKDGPVFRLDEIPSGAL